MPTLRERDERNLWLILTGAPLCVRKFSHARSSKRFHFSVPFLPCGRLRRQLLAEENPGPLTCATCESSSTTTAMRVGCGCIIATARDRSRAERRDATSGDDCEGCRYSGSCRGETLILTMQRSQA
ncbi:unnamed protein product [Lasius platythorax]|uniref:Uncharacterized protein n=1 Tax=Lasius platythorax TaxID=488582 RepID=A0AAV2N423_9HYME